MPHPFWTAVTYLGESTLLLPAALLLALWLLLVRQRSLALAWALSFGTAVALVLASKLAFMGWGMGSVALDFTGISGHATTLGTWLLATGCTPHPRRLAVAVGLGVGVVVAVSRVVLLAHSVSEVVAGVVLGALAAWAPMAWAGRSTPRLRQRWVPMVLVGALGLLPQVGQPADVHGLVQQLAMKASGRSEPFSRTMLHGS
jgi:membrane-associated phospholipid phosphatase